MKCITISLILSLILLVPVNAGIDKVIQATRPLITTYIDADTGEELTDTICTTTSINSDKGYWLTAAHCLFGKLSIDSQPVTVISRFLESDVMILAGPKVPSLRLSLRQPKQLQRVRVVGHPAGLSVIQIFSGAVSAPRTEVEDMFGRKYWRMTFDMTACGGNSGSPVVTEDDKIVSILQIGWGEPCSGFTGGALWGDLVKHAYSYFKR